MITNPGPDIVVDYNNLMGSDKYCLTTNQYRIFPKEVMGPGGKSVTNFLKCDWIGISVKTEEASKHCEEIVSNYMKETTDNVKCGICPKKMKLIRTVKSECEELARLARDRKVAYTAMIEKKMDDFRNEISQMGLNFYYEYSTSWIKYPDDCIDKDEWYDTHEEQDLEGYRVSMTFHRETLLHKRIVKLGLVDMLEKRSYQRTNDEAEAR